MQGGMVVKQVGDEGQIELVDAIDNVLGRQKTAASELIRLLEHQLGATQQIVLLCRVKRLTGKETCEEETSRGGRNKTE